MGVQNIGLKLVVSGEIGSGKTTVSGIIRRIKGLKHLSYVDLIWKPILRERALEPNRDNLQALGLELMNRFGPEGLADLMMPFIPADGGFIIDDVRSEDVFLALRERIPDLKMIYVIVDSKIRQERAALRDGICLEQQRVAEKCTTELGIPTLKRHSSAFIVNDGDMHQLKQGVISALLGLEEGGA